MSLENVVNKIYTGAANLALSLESKRNKYFDISSEDYLGFKFYSALCKFNDIIYQSPRDYIVSNSSVLAGNNTVGALSEMYIAGISPDKSFYARALGIGMTYSGLGLIFTKYLDKSRKFFKIDEKGTEKNYLLHDSLYMFATNYLIAMPFYYAAGERNVGKIAFASFVNSLVNIPLGYMNGYVKDIARDLMDVQKSKRTPKFLKNMPKRMKKAVFYTYFAGHFALSSLFYRK